ncbi:hypothetical protein GWI33_007433 [Rhynchophorus ferrugineus]|uniref:Uncharacterized protein n=1 Tax=Rhynchophorus ferrugineus TaxID=354439 RepID=A0A834MGP2_RHYFE|nr:hypothetical protein GWI33_007433 [Rhynchophorus ferrugineus]
MVLNLCQVYDKDNKTHTFTNVVHLKHFRSEYFINGKILELPIVGDGPCEFDLHNANLKTTMVLDGV